MSNSCSNECRFGFNGQEKDQEIYNNQSTTTATFWEYDGRIGRRWNLDPKPQIFISDYAAFGNSPIMNTDILGDNYTDYGVNGKGKVKKIGTTDNKPDKLYALNEDGTKKKGVKPATINDKTILPQLEQDKPDAIQKDWITGDPIQGHYATSSNNKETAKAFTFLSDNSNVEWTFQNNAGKRNIIGTLGENAQAFSVSGFKGFEDKTIKFHFHSHSDATESDFSISGNDLSNAELTWKVNSSAKYYIYAPKLTKTTWNKVYPDRKINFEPGKLIKIEKQ